MSVPFVLASGCGPAELRAEPVHRDAVNVGRPAKAELLLKELHDMLRTTDDRPD